MFIYFPNSSPDLKQRKGKTEAYVKMLDVGQGESIIIHSDGYTALIDTGAVNYSDTLVQSLYSLKIDVIDVLILTHIHLDHTGGVEAVIDNFSVENIILPELSTLSDGIASVEYAINALSHKGKGIYSAREGMGFDLGEFDITVMGVYRDPYIENNRSLIIKAEAQSKSFLFMGDAEADTENRLLKDQKPLDCDVLKVGHHGSNTSSTEDFLRAASPKIALVSAGKDNEFGHPHPSVLRRLKSHKIKTYRTDKSGHITLTLKRGKITVETEK